MLDEIYRTLFEESITIMLIIRPRDGAIIDANKAACNYYGYDKTTLTNMLIQNINTLPEDKLKKEMQEAKRERRSFFNFQHKLADGRIRDVEVHSGPIIIDNKKLLHSIIHDVTDRKRIENKIILETQFSESLINSLPGVMYVFDHLGHFKRWNKNFETVTGFSSDQIRDMNPLDFIALKDWEQARAMIETVFTEGAGTVEANFSTLSGQLIPYFLTGYRFAVDDVNYLVGVGLDISDRIATEKEKENLIEKLREALSQVKLLSGMLPICASCKKVRDDQGYWNQIELYIKERSEVEFSHSICPECSQKLYPELIDDEDE